MGIYKKIEKAIKIIVFYLFPLIVFLLLFIVYKWYIQWDWLQEIFAWRWLNLLIFLLFIKPLFVISQKYFEVKIWDISDWVKYILKWWIEKPILIWIKELLLNIVYSLTILFLKYRRILGILTFWFIFLHRSILMIWWNQQGMSLFFNINEVFILIGYVWIIALFVWFVTSNNISMKWLGKWRKYIQQIAYIALFAWAVHWAIREWWRWNALPIILIFAVLKYFERTNLKLWKNKNTSEINEKKSDWDNFKKRKCNPCGYIYDEELWDPEWWMSPGTKREDIPNDWKCPICGVWKDQFTLIVREWWKKEYIRWKVINRKMLSDNVVELWVEVFQNLEVLPWQWIGFVFDDEKWQFIRAYSVAYSENENNFTDCVFLIKILEEWRAGKKFKNMKIWDEVRINWVFGHFVLKENANEKFFIATWTWLAPIINMIRNDKSDKRTLIFGAQYKKDILLEDEIKKIPNLNYKIFLSREEVEGYEYGRIDLNKFELNSNMEFYICGAPPVVKSMLENLRWKWFNKIYYEEFF